MTPSEFLDKWDSRWSGGDLVTEMATDLALMLEATAKAQRAACAAMNKRKGCFPGEAICLKTPLVTEPKA
jgi:hypothetical protein